MPSELFFDVETTGLPVRNANPKDQESFSKCRLVSIAWVLRDESTVYAQKYYVVDTGKNGESVGASHIHGVTRNILDRYGNKVMDVLEDFMKDFRRSNILIAHNMDFDKNVVCSELFRLGMDEEANELLNCPKLCTMKSTTDICRIESKWGTSYKWPKLVELNKFLFDEEFKNQHHAMADVDATVECYYELKRRSML